MRKATRELTKDPIVLRILEQLKLQGKTEREVEQGIGLASGAFTRWKYMESKSYMTHIGKIAEYLNLTTEYLLDTENSMVKTDTMSDIEIRLIKMFRKMSSGKQNCLIMTAEYFLETEDKKDMYSKKYNRNEEETMKTSGEPLKEYENPLS
ncbi:MAG: hypothetical protein SOY46_09690 [Butyrivibrio crossotus]|nr:hypothetical protein [Butyrivibrio crossotus]